MFELTEQIKICKKTRELASQTVAAVLSENNLSETGFCAKLAQRLYQKPNWDQGWYSPPPKGLAALFGVGRVAYDSLRKEEFWPKNRFIFSGGSLGYVYASPVNRLSGIIGDFGLTIYKGADQKIINHIKVCLDITEKTAEYARAGMELREVYNYCQKLMAEKGLNNKRMLAYNDKTKTNIGHTVPWSHKRPLDEEFKIIEDSNFEKLKDLISSKRITLNARETFKIPPTIAFTIEPRMENDESPLVSFHMIVAFKDGKKEILANFKPVFQALNMDKLIVSKYD